MESALFNPLILSSMFKNLDLYSLKICREVCKTWEAIATPLFRQDSRLFIDGPPDPKNMDLLTELDHGNIPQDYNYRLSVLEPLKLVKLLNKIQDGLKSLKLEINGKEMFSAIQPLPTLESLSLYYKYSRDPSDYRYDDYSAMRECALSLSNLLNQIPNIRQLRIHHFRPSPFFETLFGPEGLGGNDKFKKSLQSLTISGSGDLNNEIFTVLRNLQLELKTLNLLDTHIARSRRERTAGQHALCLWFQDLSPSLETLHIDQSFFNNKYPLFLSSMNKLKSLEITNSVELLLPLLNQLPGLERLVLANLYFPVGGITQLETYDDGSQFPNLREFKLKSGLAKYCPFYNYIPQLFPNLKKLSFTIPSHFDLLSCIHGLKGTRIEELEILLNGYWDGSTDVPDARETELRETPPWGFQLPSFNNWKKLRQLKLTWCLPLGPYPLDIQMVNLMPRSLTSLHLDIPHAHQVVYVSFVTKLLQGLPLLMELKLDGRGIIDQDSNKMITRSELIDKIRKDPFINPNIHIVNTPGLF